MRFSTITLDLKNRLCSNIAKATFDFGCNCLFYTNTDNGLWDIATYSNYAMSNLALKLDTNIIDQ